MEGNPFYETMVRQTGNDPEAIAADRHAQARFFWEVKDVQKTTQYAAITYERDTRMPYYEEVKDLERRCLEAGKEVESLREKLAVLSGKAIDRENPFTLHTVFFAVKYGILLLIAFGFFFAPEIPLLRDFGSDAYLCRILALVILAVGICHFLRRQKALVRIKNQLYSDALPRRNHLDQLADELHGIVVREL